MSLYVNDLVTQIVEQITPISDFAEPTPKQREKGLQALRRTMANLNATGWLVPFTVTLSFIMTPGKGEYTVGILPGVDVETEPFVSIDFVNVIVDNISYNVIIRDDFYYYDNDVVQNLSGRPSSVNIRRNNNFHTLYFLPLPEQGYTCELTGKKEVSNVTWQDYVDLPNYYLDYLILRSAKTLAPMIGLRKWDSVLETDLHDAKVSMAAAIPMDVRERCRPPIDNETYYWGSINSSDNGDQLP